LSCYLAFKVTANNNWPTVYINNDKYVVAADIKKGGVVMVQDFYDSAQKGMLFLIFNSVDFLHVICILCGPADNPFTTGIVFLILCPFLHVIILALDTYIVCDQNVC